jgi:hypothetical protein
LFFGIVEVLLCALKKYLLSDSLIKLYNFVTNLVIQTLKKKFGGPACQLTNKQSGLEF